jgi:predicted dehydrogenase
MANWGFMGSGTVSRHFADSLRFVASAKPWSVTSRSQENAQRFATQVGIDRVFTDYSEMLADPALDVVYIATPTAMHADHALQAIESGKSVLVEKPFSTSAAAARPVVEAARRKGVFCMEGMWMRFVPAVIEFRRLIESGAIGEPRQLIASLGYGIAYDPTSRFYDKAAGGGALLDLGVYPISLAHFLFGAPTSINGHAVMTESGVDQVTNILLGFEKLTAQLSCSFVNRMDNDAVVIGTQGSIKLRAPLHSSTEVVVTQELPVSPAAASGGARGRLASIPALVALKRRVAPLLRTLRNRGGSIRKPFPGFGYQFEIEEVERCLASGLRESDQMSLDETIAVLETMDAAASSKR